MTNQINAEESKETMPKFLRNTVSIAIGVVAATLTALLGLFGLDKEPQLIPRVGVPYEIAATQDIKYRTGDRPPQELSDALDYIKINMGRPQHSGDGYVIREVGTMEWSIKRNLQDTISKLRERMIKESVGGYWTMMSVKSRFHMWILKVDLNPAKIQNTPGNQAIDIIVGTVTNKFGNVPIWGIFQCRHVSGSYSWSQHAWANAVDFGGDTTRLNNAAYYLLELARKNYVPVSQILWRGRNLLSGSSISGHYEHIHASGEPLRTGTPPCA
jgi:hypothetical protein